MSFNYDEILQLRVAVSDAFELAIKYAGQQDSLADKRNLEVDLVVTDDALEVRVTGPGPAFDDAPGGDEEESRSVIGSLVDRVRFPTEADGERVITLLKLRSP